MPASSRIFTEEAGILAETSTQAYYVSENLRVRSTSDASRVGFRNKILDMNDCRKEIADAKEESEEYEAE
ncbi:hypothetical protein ccbrp13_45840 [Ktedonobacteria bacterium brp13]|nr:hypothetical protein ccbrp13_45840 [Ktedonobacteria bacterium brp13]